MPLKKELGKVQAKEAKLDIPAVIPEVDKDDEVLKHRMRKENINKTIASLKDRISQQVKNGKYEYDVGRGEAINRLINIANQNHLRLLDSKDSEQIRKEKEALLAKQQSSKRRKRKKEDVKEDKVDTKSKLPLPQVKYRHVLSGSYSNIYHFLVKAQEVPFLWKFSEISLKVSDGMYRSSPSLLLEYNFSLWLYESKEHK